MALVALACAVAAAHGPAIPQLSAYSWPGQIAADEPTRTWVAPLFLARHRAASIEANVPCRPLETVRDAGSDGTIVLLSTTRDPTTQHGLAITASGAGTTTVRVGNRVLGRFAPTSAPHCVLNVHIAGEEWTVAQTGSPAHGGRLAAAPRVVALLTELDLHSAPLLHVRVLPIPQDTRPSPRQTGFRIAGAAFLAAAVAFLLWPIPRPRPLRPWHPRLAPQDGLVALTVIVWWILAPLHFDDGWVRARQQNSLESGGFSNYYEPWGANLPMATWLEWLQHFVVARSDALAIQRLPTVLVLLATWTASRACVARLVGRRPTPRDAAWWSAAVAFAAGVAAFGITLRPEPAISLLAVVVLLCCLRWLERPTLWLLVLSILLIPLSVTIHPTGAVAAGPLLLMLPRVVREARSGTSLTRLGLVALIPTTLAWLLWLAFLDADVSSQRTSLTLLRDTEEHGAGLLQELDRYQTLSGIGASSLRRLTVALILLAAVAAVAAFARKRPLPERLPAASVLLGLAIFAMAPSKWIWHFGALVALAAVAVGVEAHRLAAVKLRRIARWYLVFALVVLGLWAAKQPGIWGPIDTERLASIYVVRPYAAAVFLGVGVLVLASQFGWIGRPHLSALSVVVGALLFVTTAMFAMDAAAPGGWSAARQVTSDFRGDDSCGVASELVLSVPTSLSSPLDVRSRRTAVEMSARQEANRGRAHPTSWSAVSGPSIGVFIQGLRPVDRLRVTWGRTTVRGVAPLRSGYADLRQANWGYPRWQFVAQDDFPDRPGGANVVRFDVRGVKGGAATAVVTGPLPYRRSSLANVLKRPGAVSWVSPFLYAGMPCADLPKLAYGVVAAPNLLVDFNPGRVLRGSSLYAGIGDVFDLMRIPLETSEPLKYIVVYWVQPDPRDAIAPVVDTVLTA
jgi:hypothetical protein